jgi:acetyl esterase/lipase
MEVLGDRKANIYFCMSRLFYRNFFFDSSEDKANFSTLAKTLALQTNFPVAVPNYRLTPQEPEKDDYLRHPAHALDILQFLEFLMTWEGPQDPPTKLYDPQRIYLIGHSCSAHMLTSIFLDSSSVTPSLTPTPSLLRSIQGIIMSEGIYDLELLLESFENYREWLLIPAFGHDRPLSDFATTKYPLRESGMHIRWLVIHSRGDTLVDLPQSEAMFEHLHQSYATVGLPTDDFVSKKFDKLEGEHDDILTDGVYVGIVRDFVVA